MAYTTIKKSSDYFDTRTYSASGAGSVSDVSFQPDFLWFKNRTVAGDHGLMDAVRGVNKIIHSNDTNAEVTSNGTTNITAFTSNGFTYGASSLLDTGSGTPVTWLWKANGAGSANTDGSISSTVSANTTAGFSIVSFTGTGANATVGHGLGVTPKWIIVKSRGVENWRVYSSYLGATKAMLLNGTNAEDTDSSYWNGEPTSSVFTVGTNAGTNGSSVNMIAYCFSDVQGYSKFGSYTGTSSEVFIYTGFKPRFILIKKTSEAASWHLFDTSRTVSNGGNQLNKILFPNLSNAEVDDNYNYVDAYSNGFRCFSGPGGQGTETNKSGQTFIYMCFAEEPLVGDNPATAR